MNAYQNAVTVQPLNITSFFVFEQATRIVTVCTRTLPKPGNDFTGGYNEIRMYFLSEPFDLNRHVLIRNEQAVLNPDYLMKRPQRNKAKIRPVPLSFNNEAYMTQALKSPQLTISNADYFKDVKTTGAQQTERFAKNICDELGKYGDSVYGEQLRQKGKNVFFENRYGAYRLKATCAFIHYPYIGKTTLSSTQAYITSPLQKVMADMFDAGNKMVVLSGMSGCGKSTLAKLFCAQSSLIAQDLLLDCTNVNEQSEIDELLSRHLIFKEPSQCYSLKNKWEILKRSNDSTMLIVDNLNGYNGVLFNEFKNIGIRFIITTTLSEASMRDYLKRTGYSDDYDVIDMNHFDRQPEFARLLFFSRFNETIRFSEKEKQLAERLLKKAGYHTRVSCDMANFIACEIDANNRNSFTGLCNSLLTNDTRGPEDFIFQLILRYKNLTVDCRRLLGAIVEIGYSHASVGLLKKVMAADVESLLNELDKMNLIDRENGFVRLHPLTVAALCRRVDDEALILFDEKTTLNILKNELISKENKEVLFFMVSNRPKQYFCSDELAIVEHDGRKLSQLIDEYTLSDKRSSIGIGKTIIPNNGFVYEIIAKNKRCFLIGGQQKEKDCSILLMKNEADQLFFYNLNDGKCYPRFCNYEKESSQLKVLAGFGFISDNSAFPKSVARRGVLQDSFDTLKPRYDLLAQIAQAKEDGNLAQMQRMVYHEDRHAYELICTNPIRENYRYFFEIKRFCKLLPMIFYNTMAEGQKENVTGSLMQTSYSLLSEMIALHQCNPVQGDDPADKENIWRYDEQVSNYYGYAVNKLREKEYDMAAVYFRKGIEIADECCERSADSKWDETYSYLYNQLACAMHKNIGRNADENRLREIEDCYRKAVSHKEKVCMKMQAENANRQTYLNHYCIVALYKLTLLNFCVDFRGLDDVGIANGFNEIGAMLSLVPYTKQQGNETVLLRRAEHILKYYNDRMQYEILQQGNPLIIEQLHECGRQIVELDAANCLNPNLKGFFALNYYRYAATLRDLCDDEIALVSSCLNQLDENKKSHEECIGQLKDFIDTQKERNGSDHSGRLN